MYMPSRTAEIHLVSSNPQVNEPCDDSFLLVDALLADPTNLLKHHPTLCMEVGCGSGYVLTTLALLLGQGRAHYIGTREPLEVHGVHAELINTDIASGLVKRLAGLVDVPTPEEEVGCDGIATAWAGGKDGPSVIDKILTVADNLLSDRGWLCMVFLTDNNPSEICFQMREKGFAARVVVKRSTEEESLCVIKFWRDFDDRFEGNEIVVVDGSWFHLSIVILKALQ